MCYLCAMPMYQEWQPGKDIRVAIWKIEEPESFFEEGTGLQSDKKSAVRRLEHLAGRFLLRYLLPGASLNQIEVSHLGKPFFRGNGPCFSISHSFPFVGVAVSGSDVGIDVQTLQEKIVKIQYKFLSPEEQALCDNHTARITLAWAAKEAAFKRYGLGAVDFIRHMPIREMQVDGTMATIKMEFLREEPAVHIHLHGGIEADFAWSVTV